MSASLYMAEPPNGQVRNEINPPNLHKQLAISGSSLVVISAIAVALRFFTRLSVTKNGIQWDDYMVLMALVCSITFLGVIFVHMKSGMGYHIWDVKTQSFVFDFQIYSLVNTILYATSLALTKVSILLFYLRLSPQQWFRNLVWILISVITIYALTYDILSIFGCRPIAASWDLRITHTAKCVDTATKYMALSILNIIMDVLTLILPVPVIIGLQMSIKQKISILLIFDGWYPPSAATILLTPLMISSDYTWDAVEQYHWCFAEINASIVCASVPALKPFLVRYIPGLLGSGFGSTHRRDNVYAVNSTSSDHVLETISQKRTRKIAGKNAYELHSMDDLSMEGARAGNGDEEARLWDAQMRMESKTDADTLPIQMTQ